MRVSSRSIFVLLMPICGLSIVGYLATLGDAAAQTSSERSSVVELDYAKVVPEYANFARVTGTADEVVIDFAFVAQGADAPVGPFTVHQQTVMNYYTLKRLVSSLQVTLERHEATFGPLELDVDKRVKN